VQRLPLQLQIFGIGGDSHINDIKIQTHFGHSWWQAEYPLGPVFHFSARLNFEEQVAKLATAIYNV